MKKFLSIIFIALITVTAVIGLVACNDGGKTPGDSEKGIRIRAYEIGEVGDADYEQGYEIIGYTDEGNGVTELNVLQAVREKLNDNTAKVLKIRTGAFRGNTTLTSVIIPETVREVGAGVFKDMKKLEKITVPFIGKFFNADSVLNGTADLEDVDKAYDSERTFAHYFGTEQYTGGSRVDSYYNETTVNAIYIPQTLKEIIVNPTKDYTLPAYAFAGMTRFNISLGEKVVGLGENVFFNAHFTDKVLVIPTTVTTIDTDAFNSFKSEKEILYMGDEAGWLAFGLTLDEDLKVKYNVVTGE